MKRSWLRIHDETFTELNRRYQLSGVDLKHPFPERPWRMLGLLKFDGEAYCTERFVRALFLKTSVAGTRPAHCCCVPGLSLIFRSFQMKQS